jgi:predicted nucleotidyltransferase
MRVRVPRKRKAVAGQMPKLLNLPRNWIAQGIGYMDSGERTIRIIVEVFLIGLAYVLLQEVWHEPNRWWCMIALAGAMVHTANWVLNGNFVALCLFAFPQLKNRGDANTAEYLNGMASRLSGTHSITAILLYGSIARKAWHQRSDIDIRLLRKAGVVNLVAAWLLLTRERVLALFQWQPIDIYLADDVDFLAFMRADEHPIFLLKRDVRLDQMYPFDNCIRLGALR